VEGVIATSKGAQTNPTLPDWQTPKVRDGDKRTQPCQNGGFCGT
jgi:hypothetical protein